MARNRNRDSESEDQNSENQPISYADADNAHTNLGTRTVTVRGVSIELPNRVGPGHVLDEIGALFYNTSLHSQALATFSERAKQLREGEKDEHGDWKVQPLDDAEFTQAVQNYFSEYEWSPRGTGGPSADPIVNEMFQIAKSEVDKAMRAQLGKSILAKKNSELMPILEKYINKHSDRLRAEAVERIEKAKSMVGDDLLGELNELFTDKAA